MVNPKVTRSSPEPEIRIALATGDQEVTDQTSNTAQTRVIGSLTRLEDHYVGQGQNVITKSRYQVSWPVGRAGGR